MTKKKIIGWTLLILGVLLGLYVIVGSVFGMILYNIADPGSGAGSFAAGIIFGLAVGGICIWVGWLLSHPKRIAQSNDEPDETLNSKETS
jgi:hypothetical protein